MNGKHGDWCERLAAAVADGRYLENPDAWQDHVEGCPSCRELVQGLHALRERIDRTAVRVRESRAPRATGEQLIAEAFRRYRYGLRVKGVSLGIVILVGLGVGLAFLWRGTPARGDAVAYASRLQSQVFRTGRPDYGLLGRHEALRQEYLGALDHESSLVRRTALQALMYSGIELEPAQLERVLAEWDENLDSPVALAAAGDGARHLADALAGGRDRTLLALFSGAHVQAARGGGRLDAAVLEPFVDHPQASIRSAALRALAHDPAYRPGDRIVRRLRVDEDAEVRKAAATLLVSRGAEAGTATVVRYLGDARDWESEGVLLYTIGEHPEMLALSRERIEDVAVPPDLALHHLRLLARADDPTKAPPALIERALAADQPSTWSVLARVAAEQDLIETRDRLQRCWLRCPEGGVRSVLGGYLVRWDVGCCDESRLGLALDILETDRDRRLRDQLDMLAKSDLHTVRDRAQNLLSSWDARN